MTALFLTIETNKFATNCEEEFTVSETLPDAEADIFPSSHFVHSRTPS